MKRFHWSCLLRWFTQFTILRKCSLNILIPCNISNRSAFCIHSISCMFLSYSFWRIEGKIADQDPLFEVRKVSLNPTKVRDRLPVHLPIDLLLGYTIRGKEGPLTIPNPNEISTELWLGSVRNVRSTTHVGNNISVSMLLFQVSNQGMFQSS